MSGLGIERGRPILTGGPILLTLDSTLRRLWMERPLARRRFPGWNGPLLAASVAVRPLATATDPRPFLCQAFERLSFADGVRRRDTSRRRPWPWPRTAGVSAGAGDGGDHESRGTCCSLGVCVRGGERGAYVAEGSLPRPRASQVFGTVRRRPSVPPFFPNATSEYLSRDREKNRGNLPGIGERGEPLPPVIDPRGGSDARTERDSPLRTSAHINGPQAKRAAVMRRFGANQG
jgi:hypothetical protein